MKAQSETISTNNIDPHPEYADLKPSTPVFDSLIHSSGLDRICSSRHEALHYIATGSAVLAGLSVGPSTPPSNRSEVGLERFNIIRIRSNLFSSDSVKETLAFVLKNQRRQEGFSSAFDRVKTLEAWKKARAEEIANYEPRRNNGASDRTHRIKCHDSLFEDRKDRIGTPPGASDQLASVISRDPLREQPRDRYLLERIISPLLVLRATNFPSALKELERSHFHLPIVHYDPTPSDTLNPVASQILSLTKGTDLSGSNSVSSNHVQASFIIDLHGWAADNIWESEDGKALLARTVCLDESGVVAEDLPLPQIDSNKQPFTKHLKRVLEAITKNRYDGSFLEIAFEHPAAITQQHLYREWLRERSVTDPFIDCPAHRNLLSSIFFLLIDLYQTDEKSDDFKTLAVGAVEIAKLLAQESSEAKRKLLATIRLRNIATKALKLCEKLHVNEFLSARDIQRSFHRISQSDLKSLLQFLCDEKIVVQNKTGFALASEKAHLHLQQLNPAA